MSILKTSTLSVALIAGLGAVPSFVLADEPTTGSPAQAVDADPNETVESGQVDAESVYDTQKADQGAGAYDDSEVKEDLAEDEGSIYEEGAKSDG